MCYKCVAAQPLLCDVVLTFRDAYNTHTHTHTQGKGSIFTTDIALAVLMSAPRSVASWDILSQRAGGCLYLDVREGSSVFDNHVNETAQECSSIARSFAPSLSFSHSLSLTPHSLSLLSLYVCIYGVAETCISAQVSIQMSAYVMSLWSSSGDCCLHALIA